MIVAYMLTYMYHIRRAFTLSYMTSVKYVYIYVCSYKFNTCLFRMGLSIVVRMESYSCNDRTDNADDATERKRVRVVSPARESETDMRIRKLEEHLERQNQEIKRLKTSANNVFLFISAK